eukprot:gb/GFBE01062142.1/.p1 GENE.gb/GFBE01062142.1/~~gb/GFBE01062142.1/.p1  ORF type:complete len:443 (+),score=115.83 gb/GFBE01062142.1/:1-1329(+)
MDVAADASPAVEAEGSRPPSSNDEDYFAHVAKRVQATTGKRGEVQRWADLQRTDVPGHIEAVFTGCAFDCGARALLVQKALQVQQQFLKDRKSKRSEKMMKLTTRSLRIAGSEDPEKPKDSYNPAAALAAAAFVEVSELKTQWIEVQAFRSQQEALRFIIECQPFDYRPSGPEYDNFPRFQNSRDALAYTLNLVKKAEVEEFVSTEAMFRRRLRIRKAAPGETKEEVAAKAAMKKHKSLMGRMRDRSSTINPLGAAPQQALVHEPKRWLVEAAGVLFERPPELRSLRELPTHRYYIAVSPDMEKKVLSEGFKVTRRCSIPCSATPQEALAAFARNEKRLKEEHEEKEKKLKESRNPAGGSDDRLWDSWDTSIAATQLFAALGEGRDEDKRGPKASVLAVTIPAELGIDVIAHSKGGFIIRSQTLPASCFARAKRPGAGEATS